MNRQPYPAQTPPMPYWRGVSDLSGDTGDLLHGTYERKKTRNVLVKNGASVRSRGGLERVYDDRAVGPSHTYAARTGPVRAVVSIDAAGVRTESDVVSSFYSGYTIDHQGFPADEFDRASSGGIFVIGKPWLEGRDSDEVAARTADDHFAINGSEELIHASGTGLQAAADWTVDAPTPFYSLRADLDFTNLNDFGSVGDHYEIKFFQSLPNEVINGATVTKEAQWAVDAHSTFVNNRAGVTVDTCWSGMATVIRVEKTASSEWKMTLYCGEFVGSQPPGSLLDRNGGFKNHFTREQIFTSTGDIFTNWALECGRESRGPSSWKARADLWKEKTVAALEGGSTGSKFFSNTESGVISLGQTVPGRSSDYWTLTDNGGRFAIYSKHSADNTKQIDIPRIKSALAFLT